LAAFALVVAATLPTAADECKNRGDLDSRFCDDNNDLVADAPTDPKQWLDPDVLIFSYTPVEDPSVYENVFTEFLAYLSEKTGKKVRWYGAESYAAQVEAMRSGRLHVAGISTGPTAFGVNLAGYVPFSIMSGPKGYGYKLQLITHKDSDIKQITDLKGRNIAHVTPSSNSGNQAPRALFTDLGVVPEQDYKVTYSGKHDNSIMGVANKDYDAAPIASTVLDRMADKGVVNRDDLRIIWESDPLSVSDHLLRLCVQPRAQAGPEGDLGVPDLRLEGIGPGEGVRRQRLEPVHPDHLQGPVEGDPDHPETQRHRLQRRGLARPQGQEEEKEEKVVMESRRTAAARFTGGGGFRRER
jgi:phosphonate transport system substrate-binding protein